tara:strand:+ start:12829 stop:13815 length:987 start_codon:yes stop_codon:yes gene_type:complete
MAKNDLLKEAIADAKAVRETAIANAKLALEEAFTPKLQSMLSTKIQEEEDEDVTMTADEDPAEVADVADDTTEIAKYDEETEEETAEPGDEDDNNEMMKTEDAEMDDEDMKNEAEEDMDEDDDKDMELESIIKELEDDDDMDNEGEEEDMKNEAEEDDMEEVAADDEDMKNEADNDDDEKELDLESVINALKEEDEDEMDNEGEEEDEMKEELNLAYETIKYLKDKINEVNLLNAKLLFSNKLFRANSLNEGQKMKVIETFDRANSVREVKLVYSTLAESLTAYNPKRKKTVAEGFASKSINSTKPSKNVIVESNQFANRMKKLAGLL